MGWLWGSGGSSGAQQPAIIGTTFLGSLLNQILVADDIVPGDDVSYSLCKAIFIGHPLGSKMAESPVRLAQSQEREISVPGAPEEECIEAFQKAWEELEFSRVILNLVTQARIYGIASVGLLDSDNNSDANTALKLEDLWKQDISFNVFDPLNTAGSLVTNQDPNSRLFQKWGDIVVNGLTYHRSRTMTFMNEESLYIAYTPSSFGFVGRSVYQRALYPMKSFLQTMITDDMVTRKAGLIIARMDQAGSIIDRTMMNMFGVKRNMLKEAQTNNVLSIGTGESIESINLRNVNDSMTASRENIIKNIATAADMPAKLLTQESFVEGFGEGTQDAYAVAQYTDRLRIEMRPTYRWADRICMRRAWSPEFYEGIQNKYPDTYGKVSYEVAFQKWSNAFKAVWPSLIKEEPSEAINIEKIKFEAVIAYVQVMQPLFDPENKARLIQWAVDQVNVNDKMFSETLLFDRDDFADYTAEQAEKMEQMREMGMQGGQQGEDQEKEKPQMASFSGDSAARHVRVISDRMRAGESAREAVRGI